MNASWETSVTDSLLLLIRIQILILFNRILYTYGDSVIANIP